MVPPEEAPIGATAPGQDDSFEPAEVYFIDDLETLRACLHPLRLAVLECLVRQPLTVAQVGERLGVRSTTLYYHVRELEKAGLIRLVRTAVESGIQTKYYRAVARFFRLAPAMLQAGGESEQVDASVELVMTTLDLTAWQLRAALAQGVFTAHPDVSLVHRWIVRTTPERARAFKQRLQELIDEFQRLDQDDGDVRLEFTPVLFPHVPAGTYPQRPVSRRARGRRGTKEVRGNADETR